MRGLLACDLRCGLREALPRLALVAAVWAASWFLTYSLALIKLPGLGALTWGENLVCAWRGMLPYAPQPGQPFELPMGWLAPLVACSFAAAGWVSRDLGGLGAHMMAAARSRAGWWLSKCAWAAAVALLCWLVPLAVSLVATVAQGGDLALAARPGVVLALQAGKNAETAAAQELVEQSGAAFVATSEATLEVGPAVLAMLPMLAALLLAQGALELALSPAAGMGALAGVAILSAYFRHRWLPGGYLMLARTASLCRAGLDPAAGALLAAGIGLAAMAAGTIVITNKDLLGRREGDDR